MSYLDYLLLIAALSAFYLYDFKRLCNHMSNAAIAIYILLKWLALFVIPFVPSLFFSNVVGVSESSARGVYLAAFLITYLIITIYEDKKTGVIDEVIKKAKDDFEK